MTTKPTPTPHSVLSHVRVASPCGESWEAMPGGERVRSCERCRHKVYNLSEMTAEEAARLVQNAEGRLCVRFYRRSDGTMMTKDCPVGLRAVQLRIGTAISAAVASLSLFFGAALFGKAKPTTETPVPTTPATPGTMRELPMAPPRATMGEAMMVPIKAPVKPTATPTPSKNTHRHG